MKTSLKIILLASILCVSTACSAQKRAERHIRRAVALCPELLQMNAQQIDTVLTVPGFTDIGAVPLGNVLQGDTLYAATEHGTVVVSVSQSDSSLRVGFVAAPQKIRYSDSVQLPQVTISPQKEEEGHFWNDMALWVFGIGLGMALCVWLVKINK